MTQARAKIKAAPATPRVRVKRFRERGTYDRKTVYAILDAGVLCQIGFIFEGTPFVIPTLYWRSGRHLYFHGSNGSRMLKAMDNRDICFSTTHLDGLVLTRSAFHHSANYRSVMVLGRATRVEALEDRRIQLRNFANRLFPDRWDTLRPMKQKELRATTILRLPMKEFSAKVREGGPREDEEDLNWPAWAGVVPLWVQRGEARPDAISTAAQLKAPVVAAFAPSNPSGPP